MGQVLKFVPQSEATPANLRQVARDAASSALLASEGAMGMVAGMLAAVDSIEKRLNPLDPDECERLAKIKQLLNHCSVSLQSSLSVMNDAKSLVEETR